MILSAYQHLPEHINPVAFHLGRVEVSWYGLMYLAAFATVYFLVRYRIRRGETNISLGTVQDFFPWAIVGLLVGARLGDVLIYDWAYFQNHLSQIFLPFDIHSNWRYIGIYGMSFFGGLGGLALAFYIFLRLNLKKPSPLLASLKLRRSGPEGRCPKGGGVGVKRGQWSNVLNFTDLFAPAVPLALAFGRLGNFLNGELFGRVTTVPWGMYFPLDITGRLRHPSQIYEMLLEGILLFAILWSVRKIKMPTSYLTAFYLIGYGLARFAAEFFRQPDNNWFFISLTIGQWLSAGVIVVGIFLIIKNRAARRTALSK